MLNDKRILVTGAQKGLGRAIALELGRAGAGVALNYLDDRDAAEKTAAEIRAMGRKAIAVQADMRRMEDVRRMVSEADEALGGLTGLVNNAGIFPRADVFSVTEEIWDATNDINLKAVFFCAQHAAWAMTERGTPGSIVNISSIAVIGHERGAHYAASKGGVVSLTRTLALELASRSIRVNAVAPGLVDNDQPRGGYSEDQLAEMAAAVPLHRMGSEAEIATVVAFLSGDQSSYVTGQTIHVNGGMHMS